MIILEKISEKFPLKPILNTEILYTSYRNTKSKKKIKRIIFICKNCRKDGQMFYLGYFTAEYSKYKKSGGGCGCCRGYKWSQKQIEVKIDRRCTEMNYKFIKCNSKNSGRWAFSDKIILSCPKHGEWSTCSIANFLRDRTCPSCAKLSRPYKRIDDKRFVLQEVAKSANYSIKTELHDKMRNRDKIAVICDKGHEFPISVENFRYGRRCPECRGKNMKTLYLNSVKCEDLGVNLIKVGITKELYHRVSTQNRKNNFDFSLWHAWDFYEVSDCKEAESRIKRTLTRPANRDFIRSNFPDGHSEIFVNTGWETYRDISEIIEDYRTYKYIPNKELNSFLEDMFKGIIVR